MKATLPESVLLRAPRAKALWLLLGSIGFVIIGVIIVREGEAFGWLVIGFFSLGVPAALLKIFGKSALLLDRDGFEMPMLIGRRRYSWREVSAFEVVTVYGATMIVFDDKKSGGFLDDANRAVCGRNAGIGAALIADDIGETCALFNAFRERALKEAA